MDIDSFMMELHLRLNNSFKTVKEKKVYLKTSKKRSALQSLHIEEFSTKEEKIDSLKELYILTPKMGGLKRFLQGKYNKSRSGCYILGSFDLYKHRFYEL